MAMATRTAPVNADGADRARVALVDALGEFVLFLQTERARKRAMAEVAKAPVATDDLQQQRARVLKALVAMDAARWTSLCTVVDAELVKTALSMGALARTDQAKRARRMHSFRTPPHAQFQFLAARETTRGVAAHRELLRRPAARTSDGDVLAGFQTRESAECCDVLLAALRVMNTDRSCDTLTVDDASCDRARWIRMFLLLADGQFLARPPSKSSSMDMPWFASRQFFTLAQLVVNRIELNMWSLISRSASSSTLLRPPSRGLAAKRYLMDAWSSASPTERGAATRRIAMQVGAFLQRTSSQDTQDYLRSAKPRLAWICGMTNEAMATHCDAAERPSVAMLFALPLERVVAMPQASSVRLLIAELLQAECAKIVHARLEHSEEVELPSDARKVTTHQQRRRAARKQAIKTRRQELELRKNHQQQWSCVLKECLQATKVRRQVHIECVAEVTQELIQTAIDHIDGTASASPTNNSAPASTSAQVAVAVAPRRRKNRNKKKRRASMETDLSTADGRSKLHQETPTINASSTAITAITSPAGRDDQVSTPQRFASSFLDHSATATATFGPTPYPFREPPLYLSLTSQEQYDEQDASDSAAIAMQGALTTTTALAPSSSFEPELDWYLPSLFSSESAASSIDWDFHQWTLNPSSNPGNTNDGMPMPPSSSSRGVVVIEEDAAPAVDASSTSDQFSLDTSLTKLLDISGQDSDDEEEHGDAGADGEDDSISSASGKAGDAESDDDRDDTPSMRSAFLYREGGFFDRQRASKRRRRPFPFAQVDRKHSQSPAPREHITTTTPSRSSDPDQGDERPDNATSDPDQAQPAGNEVGARTSMSDDDDCEKSKLEARLDALETAMDGKSKHFAGISTSLSDELAAVHKLVASLTERIHTLESELEDVKRTAVTAASEAHACYERQQETSFQQEQTQAPPPPPPPPSMLVEGSCYDYQQHQHMLHHPMAFNSVLGPFVSVPMSVLPPRSKLHWDMCEFVSKLQTDTNSKLSSGMAAIRLCTATVQSLWPRAQVRPYGSFVTRLALPSSDIDLVICLPKVRRDAPADAAGVLEGRNAIKESWQQNLARKLRQEPWVQPDSVKTIPHAAIPIITLVTTAPYNVRLDISFEGPGHNGLGTNDVVLGLLHEFAPLAPIMLVLKSLIIERGFAEAYSGGLSSYGLVLMVACYLQQQTDRLSAGLDDRGSIDFGLVLMGVLDFYGNRFDPRTTGISVASRCFLNRESLIAREAMPSGAATLSGGVSGSNSDEMMMDASERWQSQGASSTLHNSNLLSSPGSRRYGIPRADGHGPLLRGGVVADHAMYDPHKFDPVFIEDPLRPSNNVGRNCFRITQIRRAFAAGYSTLMAASMSSSVFAHNRSALVGGVLLHPDNILRSILGGDMSGVVDNVPMTTTKSEHRPAMSPMAAHAGPPPLYEPHSHPPPAAPASSNPYFRPGEMTEPSPYLLQRLQQQHQYQQQQQQQHVPSSTATASTFARPASVHAYRLESAGFRRNSESVTEKMTTRSEVGGNTADKLHHSGGRRKKEPQRLGSPRFVSSAIQRSLSELEKAGGSGDESATSTPRKCPSRSLSFADVVVGGLKDRDARANAQLSPLALARPRRDDDAAIDDERLETRDDFELK